MKNAKHLFFLLVVAQTAPFLFHVSNNVKVKKGIALRNLRDSKTVDLEIQNQA